MTSATVSGLIGESAFRDCTGLTSVAISKSVNKIESCAFANCSALTSVVIPESVVSIGNGAFVSCRSLASAVIPNSVNRIESNTFQGCTSLAAFTIPESVTSIGSHAFDSCKSLTSMTIPASVMEIGSGAFESCSGLKEFIIEDGAETLNVGYIGYSGVETLYLGRNLNNKYSDALGFSELVNLIVRNYVTSIPGHAFEGCRELTEVILPPSVTEIRARAFYGDTKLASIAMGPNVNKVEVYAFTDCPATTVYITAQTPPEASKDSFSNYTGTLYVQGAATSDEYFYNGGECWSKFTSNIAMTEPTELKVDGDKTLNGKGGDTFQLTAKLLPEDVALPYVFWRSTNPAIATVDHTGLVTLRADMSDAVAMAAGEDSPASSCKIIAESLYANGPVVEITVNNMGGMDDIVGSDTADGIDYTAPVEVYNLQGVKVAISTDDLSAGLYIVRQGNNVEKIAVK